MPADQIKAKVTAMRDAMPSWIWDAEKNSRPPSALTRNSCH